MRIYHGTKVAIVRGSSKGIGKAIAQEFVNAGFRVVLNARDEQELIQAAMDIKKTIENSSSGQLTFCQAIFQKKKHVLLWLIKP